MNEKNERGKETNKTERAFGVKCDALEKARMECHGSSHYRKCPPSLKGTV